MLLSDFQVWFSGATRSRHLGRPVAMQNNSERAFPFKIGQVGYVYDDLLQLQYSYIQTRLHPANTPPQSSTSKLCIDQHELLRHEK